jgi:hypothetical protein
VLLFCQACGGEELTAEVSPGSDAGGDEADDATHMVDGGMLPLFPCDGAYVCSEADLSYTLNATLSPVGGLCTWTFSGSQDHAVVNANGMVTDGDAMPLATWWGSASTFHTLPWPPDSGRAVVTCTEQ